jgi:hypothetical protein
MSVVQSEDKKCLSKGAGGMAGYFESVPWSRGLLVRKNTFLNSAW